MRDRDILSQSQAGQLCDWLELVDEVRLLFIAVLLLIVGILILSFFSVTQLESIYCFQCSQSCCSGHLDNRSSVQLVKIPGW